MHEKQGVRIGIDDLLEVIALWKKQDAKGLKWIKDTETITNALHKVDAEDLFQLAAPRKGELKRKGKTKLPGDVDPANVILSKRKKKVHQAKMNLGLVGK